MRFCYVETGIPAADFVLLLRREYFNCNRYRNGLTQKVKLAHIQFIVGSLLLQQLLVGALL